MVKNPSRKDFVVYGFLRSKEDRFERKGTLYYIGKGLPNRPYKCSRGYRRVGCPKERSNIVILHRKLDEKTAFEYEKNLIQFYGRIDVEEFGILRNLTNGGEGESGRIITQEIRDRHRGENNHFYGKNHSAKTKKLLSDILKEVMNRPEIRKKVSEGVRKSFTEERRKKMSEARKGKRLKEETRRKISAANRGKKRSQETKDKISASNSGKKRSDEAKRRMSESAKGRKASDETKRKMSEAHSGDKHPMFGKKHSEESRRKMSESRKGKTLSQEHKDKLSPHFSGEKNPMFGKTGAQHNRGIARDWIHPVYGEHRGLAISDLVRKFPDQKLNPGSLSRVATGYNSHHKDWKILKSPQT
jgi:hypothetical protein